MLFIVLIIIKTKRNPYQSHDVCFKIDYPGATSRFTTYTPVRCSNENIVLGESIGADYGKLYYKDVDNDGFPEAIIESSKWRCRIASDCYDAHQIILKVLLNDPPKFKIISEKYLKNLVPNLSIGDK